VPKQELVCDHLEKRRMRLAVNTGLPGTWVPGVMANCNHNEIAALKLRSLAPIPTIELLGADYREVFRHLRRLVKAYDGLGWGLRQTAESYTGSLRRRYIEAERSLREDGPVGSSDVLLRAFLKSEKHSHDKLAKPRLIFPRSPRYNLRVASYLKPLEHWLWGYLTAPKVLGCGVGRVVAKGLGPRQRANLIVRKFQAFSDCVVFEVDGKAFEAHVSREQLVEEHSVYLSAYHGSVDLRRLLSHQLRLAGVTSNGVKFTRQGGRASGDFNTGMGNTLIMLAAVVAALKGQVKFDTLVDGDNALLFLEKCDLERVVKTFGQRVFDLCGHEMALESPVSIIEGVRFGRSAPVYLGDGLGWTMVRDPRAVLSGAYASHKWLREPVFASRWCNGVSRCELSLAIGVPVLQVFALSVFNATTTEKKVPFEALRDYFYVGAWLAGAKDVRTPTLECRLSFERAFGISPEVQSEWEKMLIGVRPSFEFDSHPCPDPRSWWLAEPGLLETRRSERMWQ